MQVTIVTSLSEECHHCYEFIKKKKKKMTRTQVWVKIKSNATIAPTIYLFSWEREGNPYVSNPIKNF